MSEAWPDVYNAGKYLNSNLKLLTKSSSSSSSTEFNNILPWNIFQMITNTVPISMIIVINYSMKYSIPYWFWENVNGNWYNNMIKIFKWRKSHCRTNISVRRKKEIQKSRTVGVTVRDPRQKVNHLSKVRWWNLYSQCIRLIKVELDEMTPEVITF